MKTYRKFIDARQKTKYQKNIELLYRAKQLLDQTSLKTLYFSYSHSYLKYNTITWEAPI